MAAITVETSMTFNARAQAVRAARQELKAAMRAAGGKCAALRVLAAEVEHGVPGYLATVHVDKALGWAPHCLPPARARVIAECNASTTATLGGLTPRQRLLFVSALRDEHPTARELARASVRSAPQMEIAVGPLREAFERSGKTATEVARALGWTDRGRADGPRVRRALGLRLYWSDGKAKFRQRCSWDTAEALAEAIGVDRSEVGL